MLIPPFRRVAIRWLLEITLLLNGLSVSAAETIPARLDLVAVDQTTIDFVYDGEFDVYHLVVGDRLDDVYGLELELTDLNLVATDSGFSDIVRPTPNLPAVWDTALPSSFFVGGTNSSSVATLAAERTHSTLLGYLLGLGQTLYELLPRDSAAAERTVAVLTVPAGSPKPGLTGTIGTAYFPSSGGGSQLNDLNGDGNLDLLDLDILGSQFNGFLTQASSPQQPLSLVADLNGDGVVDGKDAAAWGASAWSVGYVGDAEPAEIVIDPAFTVPGPFDLLDLDTLGTNFGATRATVGQRDLNGDQVVDLLDLDLLGVDFQSGVTTVPEPVAFALAALATLIAGATRRRMPLAIRQRAGKRQFPEGPTDTAQRSIG